MRLRNLIIVPALGLVALLAPAQGFALPNAGTNAKIVFARDVGGGNHDIFIANADGSGAVDLTNNPADDVDPAVSPDGTRIVFASNRSTAYNLFVVNVNGTGSPLRLTATQFNDRYPAWSADGNTIAYAQDSGDATKRLDLWTVNAAGTSPGLAAGNDGDDIHPAYSPDGSWLTWSSAGGIWQGTAPAAGGAAQIVFPAGGRVAPTWSPDSSRSAYNNNGTIYVWKTDGSAPVSIGVAADPASRLAWSPDGSRILFNTGAGLFTVRPDGTGLTQLTSSADLAGDWVAGMVNVRVPQISGSLTLGSTLFGDTGVWAGASSISYAYQWERCNPTGANGCQPIPGATSPTYTTTVTDLNAALRLYVTATSSLGSATAASRGSGAIGNPVSSTLPSIGGVVSLGSTLTATTGSVGSGLGTAPLSYTFRWLRCDTLGDACVAITGATAPTYIVANADAGHTLRVEVTATNSNGAATGTSLPTVVVGGLTPLNSVIPVIAGQPLIGQMLVATSGTWTGGGGISFTYQWQSCSAAGTGCKPIAGATGTTYAVSAGDAGSTLMVTVTATNSYGIISASSLPTTIVGATPAPLGLGVPGSTVDPRIAGAPVVGSALTASRGGFVGAGLSYAYQWQRCNTSGTSCSSIQGATGGTYTPKQVDVGSTIRVVVTAANALGSASAYSDITSAVVAAPVASSSSSTQGVRTLVLRGTARSERLVVKRHVSRIAAGAGNDSILAADGRREVVDCGPGHDTVTADRIDVLLHCEVVRYAKRVPARGR